MNSDQLQLLLDLAQSFAALRGRQELFATIFEKIKPVIPVDDTGLLVLDRTGQYWQDWTNVDNYQNTPAATQLQQLGYGGFLPVDRWMEYALNHTGIMTVAQFREQYPEHPLGPVMWEAGLREMMFTPLSNGGKKLGMLFFDSGQEGTYRQEHLTLFKAIADQVAVAVANILANEEILQREREKALLLSLSEDMATIRDRNDLWRVMMEKLRPLVGFDDAVVIVLSTDRQQSKTILTISGEKRKHQTWYQYIINQWIPTSEPLAYIYNIDTGYWATEQVLNQWPDFEGCLFMRDENLMHTYQVLLKQGGQAMGLLLFHFHERATIQEVKYNLYKSIADQVAVAVANILANEEILQREREKAILLSISEQLATIRDKHDLFSVIFEKLKPIFQFDDAVVVLYDARTHATQHFTHIHAAYINRSLAEGYQTILTQKIPVTNTPYEELIDLERPCILTMEYLLQTYPGHIGVQTAKAFGLTQHVFMPLRYGGQLLGFFEFHAKEKNRFSEAQMPLVRNVADQVAVAVANILANEEILEREREKTTLLSISEQLATIRDKHDLFSVIFDKLRPVFHFDDAVVVLCDEERQYTRHLHTTSNPGSQQNEHYQFIMSDKVPVAGTPYEEFLFNNAPKIYSYPYLSKQYPHHVGVKILKDFALLESVFMPLRYGGRVLGTFEFHATEQGRFSESQLPLFRNVADQVAVTVANILANEEILEREREKSVLLSISEQLATIRDKHDLFGVIFKKLQPVFKFDDAVIVLYNEGLTHTRHLISDTADLDKNDLTYQQLFSWAVPVVGSPFEELARFAEPRISPASYFVEKYPYHWGVQFGQGLGLAEHVHMPLRYGGRLLGIFEFHSKQKGRFLDRQLPLFRNVADQVAVAVANILANEEILQQKTDIEAREREKALLLSLSEDMATIRDRNDLWRVMREKIKGLIPFLDAVVAVYSADKESFAHLLGTSEKWPEDREYQSHFNTYYPIGDTPAEYLINRPGNFLWKTEEVAALYPDFPTIPYMMEMDYHYNLHLKLHWAGEDVGYLHFHFKQLSDFEEGKMSFYKAVADQVAVAVANILANEEILQREREKSQLLVITQAIALIQDAESLFDTIHQVLQPLFGFNGVTVKVLAEEGRSFRHLHANQQIRQGVTRQFGDYLYQLQPIAGNPNELTLGSQSPKTAIYQTVPLIQQYRQRADATDQEGSSVVEQLDFEEWMFTPLYSGGKLLGGLDFWAKATGRFNPAHFPLFENAASQIATAVANILANEEILEREREQSLQVALINALSEPKGWEEKLFRVAQLLQAQVPFDYLIIGLEEPDQPGRAYSFYRTGPDQYQTIRTEDFFRLTSLTPEKYAKLRQGKHYDQALVLNGADFENHCRRNGLKKVVADAFRLQSNLLFPLPLTRAGTFMLSFFSRRPDTYRARHLALLKKLQGTLALTLDRLLAYEEIEGLSRQLRLDNRYLAEEIKSQHNFEEMIGGSRPMQVVFEKLSLVAPTDATVLILGETGTGKELIARALHNLSPRQGRPLIKVNCAALPAQLIESELFGHEKGSFTGAIEQRIGKFELAQKGTIFLDEIGELPLELQAKLLRVLQEKEIERLGGKKTLPVDVRIIAATNRNIEQEVKEGRFRSDLYYRLNVFPVRLPALRERREDIPLLAVHFAEKYARKMGKPLGSIANTSMQQLLAYDWPGNIRELEFLVERATILARNEVLEIEVPRQVAPSQSSSAQAGKVELEPLPVKSLQEAERDYIVEALKRTKGQVRGAGGAAELLQINPSTLVARIAKLGIKPREVALANAGGPI